MANDILEEKFGRMLDERSFIRRMKDMVSGLRKPRDSREYKEARIELQRLKAPFLAIIIPAILLLLLAVFSGRAVVRTSEIEVQIEKPEELQQEELEDIKPPEDRLVETEVDFTDFDISTDVQMDVTAPTENAPVSAQPQAFDTVLKIKSPVILRGIFGSTRNAGTRGEGLAKYGGNQRTELSVIRALRWLKQNQQSDGSWKNQKTAMTGLAVLTFLAHGEKPGPDSPEFGETVQRALEYLITTFNPATGTWTVHDGNNYSHLIATYALCEAYGMTMNPNVREVADQALDKIIKGQNIYGGWDYKMNPASDRNDISYIGWAAQALHAADMANFYHDPEALTRACKNAIKGIKHNGCPDGGFGYTSPGKGGLTSVGTLCLQFHGAGNDPMVKNSLEIINGWAPEWVGATPENPEARKASDVQVDPKVVSGSCPQYYYYYGTQCLYQSGGKSWEDWNKRMWPSYTKAQLVKSKEQSGYIDHRGDPQETGYWMNFDIHGDRPVMDTCLAALQLMVYYRYLPTFKKVDVPAEIVGDTTDPGDIQITSDL